MENEKGNTQFQFDDLIRSSCTPSDQPSQALIAQSTILLDQLTQALTLLGEQNKFRGALLQHCVGLLNIVKEYAPSGYAPIIEYTLRLIQEDAKIIR